MPFHLALIGAGYWGKNLARNFHQLGVLHTLCDVNEALLDEYQKQYPSVHLTTNHNKILEDPTISAVAIAAPAFKHFELTKECLLSNKDVYVEKPLCLDSKEAQELVLLAKERGCILMVGHLLHYHPCVQKLKDLINCEKLGQLQYIVSNRLNLGAYRTEENALWNFAPHDVSVILSLCNNQPTQVRCVGGDYLSEGVVDTCITTLQFDNGIRAHIHVSWLHPFKEQKLSVIGSKGMIVFDDTKPWGEKLLLYKNHVLRNEIGTPIANPTEPEAIDPHQKEPLKNECEHFITYCKERTQPLTDGNEGLNVVKVLQAAQESLLNDGDPKCPQTPSFFSHATTFVTHTQTQSP